MNIECVGKVVFEWLKPVREEEGSSQLEGRYKSTSVRRIVRRTLDLGPPQSVVDTSCTYKYTCRQVGTFR